MTTHLDEAAAKEHDAQRRIVRRSLHDEVVERLRDMIVSGELEEGSRLREQVLCEQLGVSRTPLREALKVLASEGLLERLPNRGARVTHLSVADLEQMFEVMGGIEGFAGQLACARITDQEVEIIRELHDAMASYFRQDDMLQLFKVDQEIHRRIVRAARNDALYATYESLATRIRPARFKGARRDSDQQSLMDDHVEMVEALAERDGVRLGRIMQEHIRRKGVIARKAILNEAGSE
jgi:DNA-binding GntR family transcriptional regulator